MRHPKSALAIWSHKLLRWATPWFLLVAGGSGLLLALGGSPAYALVPVGLLVGLVTAVAAHLLIGAGIRPPRSVAFARSFAVVNLAFAAGWMNVVRGRRIDVWHRSEWDASADSRRL
jgi:hypothetical protein